MAQINKNKYSSRNIYIDQDNNRNTSPTNNKLVNASTVSLLLCSCYLTTTVENLLLQT